MNFEETIVEINPTLEQSGFSIAEHRTNYAEFHSKLIRLVISYNPLEHSFLIFLGRKNGEINELNNKVYSNVFQTNFQHLNGITFADKFINFLQNEGSSILQQDVVKIDEVEAFSRKAAKEYTAAIINRQNLKSADQAWDEGNYRDFISRLNNLAEDALPKSYSLKRKIALRKIGEDT